MIKYTITVGINTGGESVRVAINEHLTIGAVIGIAEQGDANACNLATDWCQIVNSVYREIDVLIEIGYMIGIDVVRRNKIY